MRKRPPRGAALLLAIGRRFPYPTPVVDKRATYQTKALFYNLRRLQGQGILFGQQDATQ